MKHFPWLLLLLALFILPLRGIAADNPVNSAGKINLRILYNGHPGSDREKDFVGFLQQHFIRVGTGDLAKFDGTQAKEADVVIFDYDGDGFKAPKPNPQNYRRATLTVGVAGALFCSMHRLKTGYL